MRFVDEVDHLELGSRVTLDLFAERLATKSSRARSRWCRYLDALVEIARVRRGAAR